MNKTTILTIILTLIFITACAQQTQAPLQPTAPEPVEKMSKGVSAGGESATVRIKGFKFVPQDLHVKVGTKVTWTNEDSAPHDVKSSDGALRSPLLQQSDQWSFTFDKPGTYDYICSLHPKMKGTVTVE